METERVDHIYNELGKFIITLDSDPLSRGPGYMQDIIARVRGYLNNVSIFLQEVLREHHNLESELDGVQAAFQVSSDELLANDARVKNLPAIDDRRSMINMILREDCEKISKLQREIRNLGHVEKAIRHRHRELEATMSAIRLQRSLIESELRTGSYFGDEGEKPRGNAWRKPPAADDAMGVEELDAIFNSTLAEETGAAPGGSTDLNEDLQSVPGEDISTTVPVEGVGLAVDEDFIDLSAGAQDVVEAPAKQPKDEDPDISKFLDGDDFSDVLDSV